MGLKAAFGYEMNIIYKKYSIVFLKPAIFLLKEGAVMKPLITLFAVLFFSAQAMAWNFDKHSIPIDEIRGGGPPKDGIPALISPKYVPAAKADFMRDEEQVIGLAYKGEARAYPLRIMSWHELVNDRLGDLPVLVSW